ncbi:hypothetical protein NL676_035794 [Syzygium grande]|nr:hypothetical protein NL676_035794 [Syzygium grande]
MATPSSPSSLAATISFPEYKDKDNSSPDDFGGLQDLSHAGRPQAPPRHGARGPRSGGLDLRRGIRWLKIRHAM